MKKRRKVIYLISTLGHGRGGHFYSLRTTAEALNSVIDAHIVNIGKCHSPVVDSAKVPHTTIYFTGWNFVSTIIILFKLIKKEQPDVLHSFDANAYLFAKTVSFFYKKPIVHTLCGGPNPTGYYPRVKNFILYSQENLDYMVDKKGFQDSVFFLISNRVAEIKLDSKRIELLRKSISSKHKTFLRIARFTDAYKNSMIQAINLNFFLNNKGFASQLIIIGAIEQDKIYKEILGYIKTKRIKNVHIITDDYFTVNASELIGIADCVIGTGRSFMEAASKGKILLTPVEDYEYPVLVMQENFNNFFKTNFSPRNKAVSYVKEKNLENIVKLFNNTKFFEENKRSSMFYFKEYFDINTKIDTYNEIYKNIFYDKIFFTDTIVHFFRTIRNFIR